MSKAGKPKGAGRRTKGMPVVQFAVDPLLVGADREFAGNFPPGLLVQCGVVPLRLFRDVGLVVAHTKAGQKGLERAQKATAIRLVSVPPIHDFGVELFLRTMDSGDENGPPLWIPEARREYLNRMGDFRKPEEGPLIAALLLTSPLASTCPMLISAMGGEGHALYLHGTSGLKTGVRFPLDRLGDVLSRLRIEFGMDGKKSHGEPWLEGRGRQERGLEDLTGLQLPLEGTAFVVEPKGGMR
ncbi:MAG TPA: hypothetical protein VE981_18375 [Planctomycetota bacterium]|nr:hypothetical protein [Planctomycetota bacterium]